MRYAERPATEVRIDVAAAPDVVWPYVTDVRVPVRYSDELQAAEWIDGGGPRLGRRFRGRNQNPVIGEWDTVSTVTVYDQPRAYGWTVSDPANPAATWLFTLEPLVNGTRLTYRVELGPGPSALSAAIAEHPDREEQLVASRLGGLRADMLATLAGIKDLVEARS